MYALLTILTQLCPLVYTENATDSEYRTLLLEIDMKTTLVTTDTLSAHWPAALEESS